MFNDLDEVIAEVDNNVNISDSVLVDKPEALLQYRSNVDKSLNVIVQNIRSIYKNFEDFKIFIDRSSIDYDLIILTECWIRNSDLIPKLDHYNYFYTLKHINQNSGVIVYIRDNIPNVTVYEPNIVDADCLVVKIGTSHAFICIYRSPSFASITNFIKSLDILLADLRYLPNIYLTGDLNIDIINNNSDPRSDDYLDFLATHCLFSTHIIPTRFNKCLDHCFVKSNTKMVTVICESSITDHHCLYLCIPLMSHGIVNKSKKRIEKLNHAKVCELLELCDWSSIAMITDPNQATEHFIAILSGIIHKSTYYVQISNRQKTVRPWVTPGLLRCMRFRDVLHKRHLKAPNNKDLEITYKRYRNHCNNILHKLKNEHDKQKLHFCKDNIKKTWNVIKQVCNLPTSAKSNEPYELFKLKKNLQDSADYINDYFINVGAELSKNILQKLNTTEELLVQNYKENTAPLNSFMLLDTDKAEVFKIAMSLKNSNSSGWDGISSIFIKNHIRLLVTPLTHIFNLCLSLGQFPNILKNSIVVPVFKSGEKDSITNYRPIALLPTIAKMLEKIINIRLVNYLEKNSIISNHQYGFRTKKSSVDAIETLVTHVVQGLDGKKKCIGVFLDIAKAFDTVSVPLLIRKLEFIGIRGVPLDLFKDYLSNRSQRVKIGDVYSSYLRVNFGVPQGSVLGPTLFQIYINSLCNTQLSNSKIITFADDTAILFQDETWAKVKLVAEQGLRTISEWLGSNLLTLNLNKTKYVTFSIKNSLQPSELLKLKIHNNVCVDDQKCNCFTLSSTCSIKYLGVDIDQNLNWKNHIGNLKARIRKLIPIFKRLRNLRDPKTNKTVYSTLCQSLVTYGISAWGGAKRTILLNVERALRCIIKVIHFRNFRYPTTDLYKEFDVLNVRQLFIQTLLLKQRKCQERINKSARRIHEVYDVPVCKTTFAQSFSFFLAPLVYNRINKVNNINNMTRFACKRVLSSFLSSLSYERSEELIKIDK